MTQASNQNQKAFSTTRWSMITQVFGAEERASAEAMDELGLRYRYAVYAYVRRCGHPPAISLDITRSFTRHLRQHFQQPYRSPEKTQFRRFLLARLNDWLAADWRETRDESEDGLPAIGDSELETRYLRDSPHFESPERAFQRAFALEVLARALSRLRAEARQTGHIDMYEALAPFLASEPAPGQYDEIARAFRTRPLALIVALKRLRQRLRELARDELADTVSSSDEFATEQNTLLAILHASG